MNNPASLKYSNSYLAKLRRIKNLPKEAMSMFKATLHRNALLTMKNFKVGITTRSFGLQKLKNGTIKRKKGSGMERPDTPLYGVGDEQKRNSYINMLRIKNIKGGYMVSPAKTKHWSRKIDLYRLWRVHELGTTINLGARTSIKTHIARGKTLIRIPPRPALLMAFRKTMNNRNIKRDARILKNALKKYAESGKKSILLRTEKNFTRGLMKYEARY